MKGAILRYPGSKANIAPWIIEHMPPHVHYCEPFFGSGSVLLTKPRSPIETVNDLDLRVINLFKVMRERPEELARAVNLTPWARQEYYDSYQPPTGDELEDARRFMVRCWQAVGTRLNCRSGWRNEISNAVNKPTYRVWNGLPEKIQWVAKRLKEVQIENRPAVDLVKRLRRPEVLLYCDPPYVLETRHSKLYANEMSDADHVELLETLINHPGPVLISGYRSKLYETRLKDWQMAATTGSTFTGASREEVLWINPVAAQAIEGNLFEGMIK